MPVSRARLSVAMSGLITILLVALVGSCRTHSPAAAPAPSPTPSRTPAAASPSPQPKPSKKPAPVALKPPPGSIITRTGSAAVALTFDDGPQATWTPQVLDLLKRAHVKATFCVIGRQVKANAALIRRIVGEGHSLCNHSWAHDMKLGRRTDAEIRADIQRTDNAIHAVVPGVPITYFRQPGGMWTAAEVRVVKEMGKRSLGWSTDPWDWDTPGTEVIVSRVLSHTHGGSIVLMHDGGGNRSQSVAALRRILPALKSKYSLIAMPV
jgi:peptidoglycan/xylan/chitin deacetylase (PgdA/CDA1 family)